MSWRALTVRTLTAAGACAVLLTALGGCGSSKSKSNPTSSTARATSTSEATTTSGSGTTGVPAKVKPCSLLSGSDVESAGGKAGVHSADDFNGTAGCDYGAVEVYLGFTKSAFDGFFKQGKPVSGVGDRASYEEEWHRLWVQAKGTRFEVHCLLCESDTEQATLVKLANVVIGKLPG